METANADEALAAVSGGAVDIALIDFNMPGIDGLELVASIRKTHPSMPVAVVSANVQNEIIGRAREQNAGFVSKPLTDEAPLPHFFPAARFGSEESDAMIDGRKRTHRILSKMRLRKSPTWGCQPRREQSPTDGG